MRVLPAFIYVHHIHAQCPRGQKVPEPQELSYREL